MAKLYSDENFPQPVVEELRRLGHDVLTIHEDGKSNQQYPDESVLQDATDYGRAVLTINRKHFRQLHRESDQHGGIISCTYNPDFVGFATCVHEAVSDHGTLANELLLVYRPA